jgi:hypothetical protein
MSDIRTDTVISADGTVIGFDQSGAGPAVILVQGALMNRSDPVMTGIAAGLSRWFTVLNYDRRGRGGSGDTQPYAVEREAEDLDALIAAAAGRPRCSAGRPAPGWYCRPRRGTRPSPGWPCGNRRTTSTTARPGCRMTSRAAGRPGPGGQARGGGRAVPGEGGRGQPAGRGGHAQSAVLAGHGGGGPDPGVRGLRHGPGQRASRRPAGRIAQPTLVLNGGASPAWMGRAGRAVASAIPGAGHRVLEGQPHYVAPEAIVPELLEFLITA